MMIRKIMRSSDRGSSLMMGTKKDVLWSHDCGKSIVDSED